MRLFSTILIAALACAIPIAAGAQAAAPQPTPSPRPLPSVRDAVTHHAITIAGKRIAYTARAGTLLLRDADDRPTASVFFVAYTADGAVARKRPVTYFWNGGPGSSTIWLHMGSFAPVRVQVPADGTQPPPNAPLVDNPSSLIDKSDLVFIDAVGTGWSSLVGQGKGTDFWGIDEDAKAFAQFIERYATRYARWESPTFLFGESYGTTRAANVANVLQTYGMAVSGVTLLSSALDYNVLPIGNNPGEDLAFIGYLPTEAAVAWYHKKVPGNPKNLDAFVAQARAFAGGDYARALRMGDKLDPAMRTATIARIHALTGLDERYIDAANMRIDPSRFQNELLRGDGKNVGRYDGRYTGPEPDRNSANPSYDPSDTNASSAFVGAWNHYAYDVLNFKDERPYNVIDFSVNRNWKYQRGEDSNAPTVVADLRNALLQNPYLHVLSANGYFDLATSFYGTEYLLDHMGLNAAQRARLHYAYFPSGHEVYLNGVALVQFKSVMVKFYDQALKR